MNTSHSVTGGGEDCDITSPPLHLTFRECFSVEENTKRSMNCCSAEQMLKESCIPKP